MAVRGVVLDMDGTLVDSNDAHARAWRCAFREAGFEVPFYRVRSLIGTGGDRLVSKVTGLDERDPIARRIVERRRWFFLEREIPILRPLEGARGLLERMEREGMRRAVASAALPEERKRMLLRTGLGDLLPSPPPSSEDPPSKPDPDGVENALRELGLEPRQVIMIGDTPYDVKAASAAGLAIVAFRCGGWTDGPLEGAVAVYDGPWDLLANFDSSPLGRSRGRASRGRPPEAQA